MEYYLLTKATSASESCSCRVVPTVTSRPILNVQDSYRGGGFSVELTTEDDVVRFRWSCGGAEGVLARDPEARRKLRVSGTGVFSRNAGASTSRPDVLCFAGAPTCHRPGAGVFLGPSRGMSPRVCSSHILWNCTGTVAASIFRMCSRRFFRIHHAHPPATPTRRSTTTMMTMISCFFRAFTAAASLCESCWSISVEFPLELARPLQSLSLEPAEITQAIEKRG